MYVCVRVWVSFRNGPRGCNQGECTHICVFVGACMHVYTCVCGCPLEKTKGCFKVSALRGCVFVGACMYVCVCACVGVLLKWTKGM
jgi:hypothetical protein